MKKIILFTGISSLLFFSCEPTPTPPSCNTLAADSILYNDLPANIYVTTVDSYAVTHCHMDYFNFPVPEDSSAWVDLDLNGDATNDFRLALNHYHASAPTPNEWCYSLNQSLTITGLNINNQIASHTTPASYPVIPYSYDQAVFFDSSSTISSFGSSWKNSVDISATNYGGASYGLVGSKYVGVKLRKNGNDYYGWILLMGGGYSLLVHSYAINTTAGNCINAGEQ